MRVSAEETFDRLWRDHAATVLRYAHRRVAPGEVDDVVAETFVVAWRRLGEVPERPLPWLLGVARGVSANLARSSRRRQALQRQALEGSFGAAVPDIADEVTDRVGLAAPGHVQLALARLSDADRELLTLIAWDGLSHHEAAEVLRCSPGTLKVRLHRARGRLRRLVADGAVPSPVPSPDPDPAPHRTGGTR